MKKITLFAALVIFGFQTFDQNSETVQYAKLEDNPELVSDKLVALHAVGQFGKNTDITVGHEANALFKIQD